MEWVATRTKPFELVGGGLCLDFTNTTHCHGCDDPRDDLMTYYDLVSWSQRVNILGEHEAQSLLREAAGNLAKSTRVLQQAKTLRNLIYRIFSALANQRTVEKADLSGFNQALSAAMKRSEICATAQGLSWGWLADHHALDRMLWPVVRSAADLLTSEELNRLRQCEGNNCTWLFLDVSKNRRRRWCDMRECGNRAKAHRHYERRRTSA